MACAWPEGVWWGQEAGWVAGRRWAGGRGIPVLHGICGIGSVAKAPSPGHKRIKMVSRRGQGSRQARAGCGWLAPALRTRRSGLLSGIGRRGFGRTCCGGPPARLWAQCCSPAARRAGRAQWCALRRPPVEVQRPGAAGACPRCWVAARTMLGRWERGCGPASRRPWSDWVTARRRKRAWFGVARSKSGWAGVWGAGVQADAASPTLQSGMLRAA